MSKGLLAEVMPVDKIYPFTRDGKREFTSCKQCAVMLDDAAEFGNHRPVGSTPEGQKDA